MLDVDVKQKELYINNDNKNVIWLELINILTHSFAIHPFSALMFSGGREKLYWEQMG